MWLHALFCSPESATELGTAWLLLRSVYPVIWMLRGQFDQTIFVVTIPVWVGLGLGAGSSSGLTPHFPQMYGIILHMTSSVVCQYVSFNLRTSGFFGYNTLGVVAHSVGFLALFFAACGVMTAVRAAGFFPAKKD